MERGGRGGGDREEDYMELPRAESKALLLQENQDLFLKI